jgi:hypothetical protein
VPEPPLRLSRSRSREGARLRVAAAALYDDSRGVRVTVGWLRGPRGALSIATFDDAKLQRFRVSAFTAALARSSEAA